MAVDRWQALGAIATVVAAGVAVLSYFSGDRGAPPVEPNSNPQPVMAASDLGCQSPAQAIAIGASASGDIPAGQAYPANARYYCVTVPEGTSSMTLELSDMNTDLDLYVGRHSLDSVQGINVEAGENYEWKSNQFDLVDERVTIPNPEAGVYYAEIVSYQGNQSNFRFAVR